MAMLGRACTAALCFLTIFRASAAAAWTLGQGSVPGVRGLELHGGRQLTQDGASAAKCEWSDEASACFLEYLDVIPDGELKDFYVLDTICSNITTQNDCEAVEGCIWDDFCFVFLEDEIENCTKADPTPGSLCSLLAVTDKCEALLQETNCTQAAECQWELLEPLDADGTNVTESDLEGACFASQEAIVNVEFATAADLIPDIVAGIKGCSEITNADECEGTGEPQG